MLRLFICLFVALTVGCNLFGETPRPGTPTADLPDTGGDLDAANSDATQRDDATTTTTDDIDGGDSGSPESDACTPETDEVLCDEAGVQCGELEARDLCGELRLLTCGPCGEGETCDDDGQCVCVSESDETFCRRLGKDCDEVTELDSCGVERTVDCGGCSEPEHCGGGGANVCGCPQESDAVFCDRIGAQCDDVTALDSCGVSRTSYCGACGPGTTCSSRVCVCQPETDVEFCERVLGCGVLSAADNCGQFRTRDCQRDCPSGEQCVDEQCTCNPEPTATFCANNAATCGEITTGDNCGINRTENCGTCATTSHVCFKNDCHLFPSNGLILNLVASSGVQTSQQRVTGWVDQVSGSVWNPLSLAERPLRIYGHNNHRAIRFSDTQRLQTSDILSFNRFTISIVLKRNSTMYDGTFLGSSKDINGHHEFTLGSRPDLLRVMSSSGIAESLAVVSTERLEVLTITANATKLFVYQGHPLTASGDAYLFGSPIEIDQIGAIHDMQFLSGDIYEIYVWDRSLAEQEIHVVVAELRDRYDL